MLRCLLGRSLKASYLRLAFVAPILVASCYVCEARSGRTGEGLRTALFRRSRQRSGCAHDGALFIERPVTSLLRVLLIATAATSSTSSTAIWDVMGLDSGRGVFFGVLGTAEWQRYWG